MTVASRLAFTIALLSSSIAWGQATKVGPGIQVVPRAAAPGKDAANGAYWGNSADANKPYYTTPAGVDIPLSGGNETLAQTYALGAAAADQTMLISAADGGPVICKANAAATGALLQVQSSAAVQLFSVADNAQAYIAGSATNAGTNKGVVIDAKTALIGSGRPYLSVQNGGTEQWAMYTDLGDGNKVTLAAIDPTPGASAVRGNVRMIVSNNASASVVSSLDLTDVDASLSTIAGPLTYTAATSNVLRSTAADGATSLALSVDTTNAWTNATATLAKLATNAAVKFQAFASGLLELTRLSIGTAQTAGLTVQNTTAAAAGAQQYSPVIELEGQGWKTNATAASQEVKFGLQTRTVQGAANPDGNLDIMFSVNGGAFSTIASLYSSGVFGSAVGYFNIGLTNGLAMQALNGIDMYGPDLSPISFYASSLGATRPFSTITARHFIGAVDVIPTCATGTGGGTGSTCSTSAGSTDFAGTLNVTTAGADEAANATVATVTFNTAYGVAPRCVLANASATAQALLNTQQVASYQSNTSTTVFVVTSGSVALVNAVTYVWNYHCIQ